MNIMLQLTSRSQLISEPHVLIILHACKKLNVFAEMRVYNEAYFSEKEI